jgi:hypothetical protein
VSSYFGLGPYEGREALNILEEEPLLASKQKLPWLVSAFVYPASTSGLVHIAVFVFLPRIVSLIVNLLASAIGPILREGTGYIIIFLTVPFYILFYSYVTYYTCYRINDSGKGNMRASDVPISDTFIASDFISEVVLLFGCAAICFWPPPVYYMLTKQTDLWFWVLSLCGGFFFPMALLRGVLFESFDALNPVDIIKSIIDTFLSYCGLVIFSLVIAGFILAALPRLPIWGFVIDAMRFYLVFVVVHRLGWFYWWNKDRLGWGL